MSIFLIGFVTVQVVWLVLILTPLLYRGEHIYPWWLGDSFFAFLKKSRWIWWERIIKHKALCLNVDPNGYNIYKCADVVGHKEPHGELNRKWENTSG